MDIRRFLRKLIRPNPYNIIKKNSEKFNVAADTVFFDSTAFNFNVANRTVNPCINIGRDCLIGCEFIFDSPEGRVTVGDRTYIGGGTKLISKASITIGNDVTIAWQCCFYDHDSHSLNWESRAEDIKQQMHDLKKTGNILTNKNWSTVNAKPIVVCDKAWIGFDVLILKGVTIGEGAIVGAKSVVTKDVEPWTVVAGNPAQIVKHLDKPHD